MAHATAVITRDELDRLSPDEASRVATALEEELAQLKDFLASEDARLMYKAVNGLGTDEGLLIDILCERTKAQLKSISKKSVEMYGKTLLQFVKDDISGNFGKMVTYSLMEPADVGAKIFQTATKGLGTDDNALVDLIATRTNAELAAIKTRWEAKYNKGLIDVINSEYGVLSKSIRRVMIEMFQGRKDESTVTDPALAKQQAEILYKAGIGRVGTDDGKFIDILVSSNRAQIQLIKQEYERSHNMSLQRAIEKETSRAFKSALIAFLQPSVAAYTALALRESFQGVGTDLDRLCRVLGSTDKTLMPEVNECYLHTYGKTIVETLKAEVMVMGDFLAACKSWCANTDPTQGRENAPVPNNPKELAVLRWTEREHLRDFLAIMDAKSIRRACQGIGTRNKDLVNVVCARSKEHLSAINAKYHTICGLSLVEEIKGECSGHYKQLLTNIVQKYDDVDSVLVKAACDGLGTDELTIIELLAPRTNDRIRQMKKKYDARNSTALIDRLNSELSGDLKRLIIQLLKAERDEDAPANLELANQQANALHAAGVARWGTDEKCFIDILCKSSRAQIALTKERYEILFNHSMRHAIVSETSGYLKTALKTLLYQPHEYYASALYEAFKGIGTDDQRVVRILGSHDKNELTKISDFYLSTYGKTLAQALKSELSGYFRTAAIAWVSIPDPMELVSLQRVLSAKNLPSPRTQAYFEGATQAYFQGVGKSPPPGYYEEENLPKPPGSDTGGFDPATAALGIGALSCTMMHQGDQKRVEMVPDIAVGVGWTPAPGKFFDLDASVILLDNANVVIDTVYFANKTVPGIVHGGDSRTGELRGDDEIILLHLSQLDPRVVTLAFAVHCFTKNTNFGQITEAYVRLVHPGTGNVKAIYKLDQNLTSESCFIAMMRKQGPSWTIAAVGRGIPGNCGPHPKTVEAVSAISAALVVQK